MEENIMLLIFSLNINVMLNLNDGEHQNNWIYPVLVCNAQNQTNLVSIIFLSIQIKI